MTRVELRSATSHGRYRTRINGFPNNLIADVGHSSSMQVSMSMERWLLMACKVAATVSVIAGVIGAGLQVTS